MARRDTDDDAPWLAAADGGREVTTVSRRSLFWTVIAGLVLIGAVVVGGVVLMAKKQGGSTAGYMEAAQAPLIAAEPGPYKVKPDDPKGMAVEGQDQIIYPAGQGEDQAGTIDTNAVPEEPLARPGTPDAASQNQGPPRDLLPSAPVPPPPVKSAAPAVAALPPPVVVKPATVTPPAPKPAVASPQPKPAKQREPLNIDIPDDPKPRAEPRPKPAAVEPKSGGGIAQLGAFSSEDKADAAWEALGGKTGGYGKHVIKVDKDGKTLFRLRATGGDAAALCERVKAGGGVCTVVD